VPCSLLTGQGLNDLRAAILDILSINPATPPHATISERHFHCVQYTVNAINEAMAALQSFKDEGFVIAAQHLRNGLESMGRVTGRIYDNELLDGIFSKFCIGK
jgi:tRNA modification GTPase